MRLFNQKNLALRWDMSGKIYECEPWGSIEVDEALLAPIRSRGLPLDTVPVAPELKAHQRVAEAQAGIANEELAQLRSALLAAQAETAAARREIDLGGTTLAQANERADKATRELASLRSQLEASNGERAAAESLLAEQAHAESQAVADMTRRAAEAAAEASATKAELARVKETLAESEKALVSISKERDSLVADIVRLKADKKASDDLLGETATRAQDAEKRAAELDAVVRETRNKKLERGARA